MLAETREGKGHGTADTSPRMTVWRKEKKQDMEAGVVCH